MTVKIVGQSLLAGAVLAFNGRDVDVRGRHFSLGEELAPGGTDSDDLERRLRFRFNQGDAGGGRVEARCWELNGELYGGLR